ncbi:hypothetical protein [Mucilaginibacter myungsuensis]|uniref:Uncharacterized protein n=1 Tax=Mucilaginibacter myungsuensis TaxID=649104 RepID=A0A929L0M3_9SPHI|nr:hypothetical protein [Mucilaginibacter myungsuensis]MBE9662324.1 hypothetical protein [Mucilaginibacter myungsuensis]MDN3599239.1 hypothetical protein [Mucilaginibacter myungsuensis]
MSYFYKREQKSPPRRFLLILGIALLVSISAFGLMILFWPKLITAMALPEHLRIGFGVICIIYGILRSSRLIFKKQTDEY